MSLYTESDTVLIGLNQFLLTEWGVARGIRSKVTKEDYIHIASILYNQKDIFFSLRGKRREEREKGRDWILVFSEFELKSLFKYNMLTCKFSYSFIFDKKLEITKVLQNYIL